MKMTREEKIARPYRLADAMNEDIIGNYATKREMNKAFREYDEECEGDWIPVRGKFNPSTNRYDFF